MACISLVSKTIIPYAARYVKFIFTDRLYSSFQGAVMRLIRIARSRAHFHGLHSIFSKTKKVLN